MSKCTNITEQSSISETTLIPQYVLDTYHNAVKRQFSKHSFEVIAKLDPRVHEWFKNISIKYGFQISPHYVYLASIKHGLTSFAPKKCLYCGKILGLDRVIRSFCSKECRRKSDIPKKKAEATSLKRYGVTSPSKSKIVQAKMKATCLARYGVQNAYQSSEIKEKIKKTNLSKLGVEYPMQSAVVRDKFKQTCLQKYGVSSFSKTNEYKEKNKHTMLERYGVDNTLKSKELRKKFIKTMINKYGVPYSAQSEEIRRKFINTKRNHHFDIFTAILKSKDIECLSNKQDYIDYKPIHLKCLICSYTWQVSASDIASKIVCECCKDKALHCRSNKEVEVLNYIKSLYHGKIIHNTKQVIYPLELDIYLPKKKLAFEFNGTYWHSENAGMTPKYHFYKTQQCNHSGIRLVHIFEHEWDFNQKKVKALIRSALGLYKIRIYARQCSIKEISSNDYELFLLENHLQGTVNSSIRYGLFYKNELISAIGFGKSRYIKDEVELYRYCTKADYQVIGGFSKLVKYACRAANISTFSSYIDLAHFSGRGYKKIGFKKVSVTKPSYLYIKGSNILSRYQCQKHKLKKLLGSDYHQDLTETENMMLARYLKVYDAGTLKVVYNY